MVKKYQSNELTKTYLGCIKKRAPYHKQPDRNIKLGSPDYDVPNNAVETTKYNLLTFFPKNFMIQISKSANMYFFIMGIWQMIPQITTTDGHPLVYLPLSIIITVSMIKDFLEDWRRRKEDNKENNSIVKVLRNGKFEKTKAKDIRIGDIILVKENHFFHSDILLLKVPQNKNLAYMETKNLDGETNLKPVQVHQKLMSYWTQDDQFQNHDIQFYYEKPSLSMYTFNGYFQKNYQKNFEVMTNEKSSENSNNVINMKDEHHNFDINNFMYRGSILRNVEWAIGIVLYTGHDTKIMLNSISGKYKTSKVEKQMNLYIIFIFSLLVGFSLFSAIYSIIWQDDNIEGLRTYSEVEENLGNAFLLKTAQWLLLLSNFVPISLLVTIELVKFGQGIITSIDHNYKYRGMKAEVNSSNLNEQLGLVNYIFSDKTGTLTSNLMRFKSLLAGDISYGHQNNDELKQFKSEDFQDLKPLEDEEGIIGQELNQNELVDFNDPEFNEHMNNINHPNNQNIIQCLTCINLCNTVQVEIKNEQLKYLASSPDECALVNFAQEHNFQFQGKDENNTMFILHNKQILKYELLNTLEFSYERKRMSVIVKDLQNGEIILYSKGADQIIHSLMCPTQGPQQIKQDKILKQYSVKGLRTLCLAKKILPQDYYHMWSSQYNEAKKSLSQNRNIEIFRLQNEIEQNLQLIGATAIEDKLQTGIADTINSFKNAGIQTWMLTGDKIETAINIGKNCELISKHSDIIVLNNPKKFDQNFEKAQQLTEQKQKFTLVISGQAFEHIKKIDKLHSLTQILLRSDTVIGCRVTPKEKQEFVCLIKNACKNAITLAVGDGANDVSMITESHVGVGIQGLEGREAAKASDFAIGQFRHLRRLLFYTGQECYRRNSGMIFFNFYKNQSWILTTFFFGFYSGFSGQYLYDQILQQFFNTFFAALPIILFSLFDEIHPSSDTLEFPQKKPNKLEELPIEYYLNREYQLFSGRNFWGHFLKGIVHSLIFTLIGIYIYSPSSPFQEQYDHDLFQIGMYIFSLAVIVNNLKVILMHHTHYGFTLFFSFGSTIFYFVFFYIVSNNTEAECNFQFTRIIYNINSYYGLLIALALTSFSDLAIERFHGYFIRNQQYQNKLRQLIQKKEEENNLQSSDQLLMAYSDSSPVKKKLSDSMSPTKKGYINDEVIQQQQSSDEKQLKNNSKNNSKEFKFSVNNAFDNREKVILDVPQKRNNKQNNNIQVQQQQQDQNSCCSNNNIQIQENDSSNNINDDMIDINNINEEVEYVKVKPKETKYGKSNFNVLQSQYHTPEKKQQLQILQQQQTPNQNYEYLSTQINSNSMSFNQNHSTSFLTSNLQNQISNNNTSNINNSSNNINNNSSSNLQPQPSSSESYQPSQFSNNNSQKFKDNQE